MSTPAVEQELKKNENTYVAVLGKLAIEAAGDKILILEDAFASGYECETCKGTGRSSVACARCKGQGGIGTEDCRTCSGTGKMTCTACEGKTVDKAKGGLIIPEESQRRPSTGIIVSCGPDVKGFTVGDHVIYSNFSGVFVNLRNKQVMRFMREHEPYGKLYGVTSAIKEILQ